MLQSLIDAARQTGLHAGEVLEFHESPDDGSVSPHGRTTLERFIEGWGYGLSGQRWNDQLDSAERPAIDRKCRYVGLIHDDGALLIEVNEG
jgi:hypothetical protein